MRWHGVENGIPGQKNASFLPPLENVCSQHLKNTILTSVKLQQMQFRKTGKGGSLLVS